MNKKSINEYADELFLISAKRINLGQNRNKEEQYVGQQGKLNASKRLFLHNDLHNAIMLLAYALPTSVEHSPNDPPV